MTLPFFSLDAEANAEAEGEKQAYNEQDCRGDGA